MRYKTGLALLLLSSAAGWGWTPFEVSRSNNTQLSPSVSGTVVVWQESVQFEGQWHWDIYGVDLVNDPEGLILAAALEADQTRPSIWGSWVVWEDNFHGDTDIWVSDISDTENVQMYNLTPYENDQARPRVHGNTVVWQHLYVDAETQTADWDIYAADITDPANPLEFPVAVMEADQQRPDVYRHRIVWQDTFYGNSDILFADAWRRDAPDLYVVSEVSIEQNHPVTDGRFVLWHEEIDVDNTLLYGADVSDPDRPVEFLISDEPGDKRNLSLSGHLVVWQDNRSGSWNIYGYNLITRQEFAVTDDVYNQTAPAIDGLLAAYEDDRYGNLAVFAVYLDGPYTAYCHEPLIGDVNGDCRVNLEDLMAIAAEWLTDALVY